MTFRVAKQIIYGTFYIVVWVAVIFGVHAVFFRPKPLPPPVAVVQPVAVLGVNVFTASPGHYTFLAKIANQNADFAAQYFPFSFDLYSDSGAIVQSLPGASFLYPSQVKYVVLVNQPVVNGATQSVEPIAPETASGTAAIMLQTGWALTISASTTEWIASSSFGQPPDLVVQNVSTQIGSPTANSAGTALATGEVVNNDTATFKNIFIVAVFKDASGNPIGASQTELSDMQPNSTEHFSVSYPVIPGLNPAATEVDAYAVRGYY